MIVGLVLPSAASKSKRTIISPAMTKKKAADAEKTSNEEDRPPKRPLSAYNFFFKAERARFLGKDPNEADNCIRRKQHRKIPGMIGFKELAVMMGERWKRLPEEEREPYTQKFEQDRIRYKRETREWEERRSRKRLLEIQALKNAAKQKQQGHHHEEKRTNQLGSIGVAATGSMSAEYRAAEALHRSVAMSHNMSSPYAVVPAFPVGGGQEQHFSTSAASPWGAMMPVRSSNSAFPWYPQYGAQTNSHVRHHRAKYGRYEPPLCHSFGRKLTDAPSSVKRSPPEPMFASNVMFKNAAEVKVERMCPTPTEEMTDSLEQLETFLNSLLGDDLIGNLQRL
jgi:hypothetical protein